MELLIIFGALFLNAVFADQYTSQFDNTDIDTILKNDRLVRQYIDCLVDKKPCTRHGQTLKDHVYDALHTSCEKCTEVQKNNVKKVIRNLVNNKPDWWKELTEKYDPEGQYQKQFDRLLKDAMESE